MFFILNFSFSDFTSAVLILCKLYPSNRVAFDLHAARHGARMARGVFYAQIEHAHSVFVLLSRKRDRSFTQHLYPRSHRTVPCIRRTFLPQN